MAARFSWLFTGALLALALVLRYFDPAPIESMRLNLFDEYQRLWPAPYEDAGVRIVDIDDDSLSRLGQWPWPRTQLAALLTRLGEAGAAVVAFDAVFSEPDRTSPTRVIPLWQGGADDAALRALGQRLPDHDTAFANVIAKIPSVLGIVLTGTATDQRPTAKAGFAEAGDDPRPFLTPFDGAVTNLTELETQAAGIGSFNIEPERDGLIRRVPLFYALRGKPGERAQIIPSLAAEALRVALGASTYIIKSSGASGQTAFGAATGVNHVRIGRAELPTDPKARLWLRDTGDVPERVVPAWKVLAGEVEEGRLDGTIVFIGTSAPGLKDLRATPLNRAAAGVEIHARITEQAVLGLFLQRPDWLDGAELVYLLVFGLALLILLPRRGPVWCAAMGAGGTLLAFTISIVGFAQFNILIDPLYPSLSAIALYLAASLLVFLRSEGERRRVRTAFSRYMSPALVEQLAADPARLTLGGETRDMTLLFCDVRDFTTLSETMDAGTLTRFINRFLTPMTEIILDHRGTIDKYMGDAIMAFWNAPLDDPDHAPNAARAALAMIKSLERLNVEWEAEAKSRGATSPYVAIGIGLNSGPCCVGNMGSDLRFDYSVIGDDVNLASRLEGQSKTYGVPIVIGENTRARLDRFAVLELDLLRVKGKQRPVRIFALLGDESMNEEPWFRTLSEAQGAMLKAYRARDWSRATSFLTLCRTAAEGRLAKLWDLYAERIAELRGSALPADWDGVAVATRK